MLVGDVNPLRLPALRSPPMLSAGSPVSGTAIASNDAQVSAAYSSSADWVDEPASKVEVRGAPAPSHETPAAGAVAPRTAAAETAARRRVVRMLLTFPRGIT